MRIPLMDAAPIDCAHELVPQLVEAIELVTAIDKSSGSAVYVMLPDGGIVRGFNLVREQLTDGSFVYNIMLSENYSSE